MFLLHLLHVLAGLFLLFISIKQKVHVAFYYIILVVALYALVHHAYNFIITLQILYLFHLIVIIPVICIVGFLKYDTPDYLYKILLFIAFGTIGYHGYNLLKEQLNIYHGSLLAIILIILFV